MSDLITLISELTTIAADMLIILPFLSRRIRRKLFTAIITDIIYDIIQGKNGEVKNFVQTMKNVVDYYEKSHHMDIRESDD